MTIDDPRVLLLNRTGSLFLYVHRLEASTALDIGFVVIFGLAA